MEGCWGGGEERWEAGGVPREGAGVREPGLCCGEQGPVAVSCPEQNPRPTTVPHSKLPSWARAVTPRIFYITEKAWNYYPYTITGEPRAGRGHGHCRAPAPPGTLTLASGGAGLPGEPRWWPLPALTAPSLPPVMPPGDATP